MSLLVLSSDLSKGVLPTPCPRSKGRLKRSPVHKHHEIHKNKHLGINDTSIGDKVHNPSQTTAVCGVWGVGFYFLIKNSSDQRRLPDILVYQVYSINT